MMASNLLIEREELTVTRPQPQDEAPAAGGTGYVPDLGMPQLYITTHRPNWLWDGRVPFPLMVSFRTLRTVAHFRPATVPEVAIDSGGYMELAQHGRWTISAREYLETVARFDQHTGNLAWVPCQDWMTEEWLVLGGAHDGRTYPGTRQFLDPQGRMSYAELVTEHQRRTTASYLELTQMWPQFSDAPCPVMPVLQPPYERHAVMYAEAGVSLASCEVVGIGSVCRVQSTPGLIDVAAEINGMNILAHYFGLKLTAIKRRCIVSKDIQVGAEWYPAGAGSLDTASWSFDARYADPLPGCTHTSPKTGLAPKCNNCPVYAAAWREKVVSALRQAQHGLAFS